MDMSQYLEMFLEEAKEHLQKMNESLLTLESDPEGEDIVNEIFRSAHTLKGMSATMGYNQIAELTHEMENVLHKIRSGDIELNSFMVDLLFKAVDLLDSSINSIAAGNEDNFPIDEVVNTLRAVLNKDLPSDVDGLALTNNTKVLPVFNEYEKNLILEALEQEYNCFGITININPKCVMKSARSFMVFKQLEQIGEIIKCTPSVEDIEEEKFGNSFHVVVITREEAEALTKALLKITEIEEPIISQIKGETLNIPSLYKEQELSSEDNKANSDAEAEGSVSAKPSLANSPDRNKKIQSKVKVNQSVRVDINRLDSLINLVGELVINKTRLVQIGRQLQFPELTETLEQMDRISVDLQNVVMKVRMVPIDLVFNRFPRMVRDLAKELGKDINLIIEGKETELDRTVIDEIGDPLVHLLRNSVDHGVETPEERSALGKPKKGQVTLIARHEGNNVIIEVIDDGRGLDANVIRKKALEKQLISQEELAGLDDESVLMFIFQPGFSTAKKVTDVSGRGVGLDVVKNKIEALSGSIQIESKVGEGTRFKIQLPLTLAIIQALLVRLEEEIYAIPLSFIAETTSIFPQQLNNLQDQEVMLLRGDVLPLIRLHKIFDVPMSNLRKEEEIDVVVVRKGEKRAGLIVDALMGQQEIVIKSLGSLLGGIPMVSGATILGNGQVSLIIDVASLF